MTEKELSKLYYLKMEIKDLKDKIKNFDKTGMQSSSFGTTKGGSSVGNVTEKVALEKVELKEMLEVARDMAEYELCKIEEYIGNIDDTEMRLIMRLRHIECMSWEQIGARLYMHHTTALRKYKKFLESNK